MTDLLRGSLTGRQSLTAWHTHAARNCEKVKKTHTLKSENYPRGEKKKKRTNSRVFLRKWFPKCLPLPVCFVVCVSVGRGRAGWEGVELFNDSRKYTRTLPPPPPKWMHSSEDLADESQSHPSNSRYSGEFTRKGSVSTDVLSGASWVALVWWRNTEIKLNQISQQSKKIKVRSTSIWVNSLCQYGPLQSGTN